VASELSDLWSHVYGLREDLGHVESDIRDLQTSTGDDDRTDAGQARLETEAIDNRLRDAEQRLSDAESQLDQYGTLLDELRNRVGELERQSGVRARRRAAEDE